MRVCPDGESGVASVRMVFSGRIWRFRMNVGHERAGGRELTNDNQQGICMGTSNDLGFKAEICYLGWTSWSRRPMSNSVYYEIHEERDCG